MDWRGEGKIRSVSLKSKWGEDTGVQKSAGTHTHQKGKKKGALPGQEKELTKSTQWAAHGTKVLSGGGKITPNKKCLKPGKLLKHLILCKLTGTRVERNILMSRGEASTTPCKPNWPGREVVRREVGSDRSGTVRKGG